MKKKRKYGLGTVALLILFLYFAYTFIGQQKIIYSKKAEAALAQGKVNEETSTNEQLKDEQKKINSDEYIEKVAREKLGMVKQGEKVFVDIGN